MFGTLRLQREHPQWDHQNPANGDRVALTPCAPSPSRAFVWALILQLSVYVLAHVLLDSLAFLRFLRVHCNGLIRCSHLGLASIT